MNIQHKYTWIKQPVDERDYTFDRLAKIKNFSVAALPKSVSNRKYCPAVFDQGQLGSCTANAWAGLLGYNECLNGRGGKLYRDMSRLFIYYNERVIENSVSTDSGAQLRDGANALATKGVCTEGEWPYIVSQFTIQPPAKCYTNALPNAIHSYYALNTLTDLKTTLANGQCFVFGFTVYDSFESQQMANTGIMTMPAANEQVLGGHAVMGIGYDDTDETFIIRNSWGKGWGLPGNLTGYFKMGYDYMTTYASDWWTVVKDI